MDTQLPLFEMPAEQDWPFAGLDRGAYSVLSSDPPWRFATYSAKGKEKKSAECHYDTMTLDDIKALPVAELAAPDAALFLWATAPMLVEGLDVMKAWGFSYKSHLVWGKLTVNGKLAYGTGFRFRGSHEVVLLGVRGNPKNTRGERSLLMAPRREHSRKPEEFYAMVERWMPDARRIDLFSRQSRPNWDNWGAESSKFDLPPKTKEPDSHAIRQG